MPETLKPEIVADLLKDRLGEGRELLKIYTQAGIVFLAINAALATLAFKDAVDHKWLFETLGIASAVFFIAVCALERTARKRLEADIVALNERLGKPLQEVGFPYLGYSARAALVWSVLAAIGWTVALLRHL